MSKTTIQYRIRNQHSLTAEPRSIEVDASTEELDQLARDGFWVRDGLVSGNLLQRLRDAADEIEAEELRHSKPFEGGGFGGLFIRNIIDRNQVMRDELMSLSPLLSVARAMIAPQVQIHASVLRVAYSELTGQNVEWHFHQRVVPDPVPPFFFRPVVLDNLIYLDDLTEDTGPLVVLPGSHLTDLDLPSGDHSDKPGQVVVTAPAGSCVTSHSSLWHKALAPKPGAPKRRLLIVGHSPVWMKQIDVPGAGLTKELLERGDPEHLELLGRSGYY